MILSLFGQIISWKRYTSSHIKRYSLTFWGDTLIRPLAELYEEIDTNQCPQIKAQTLHFTLVLFQNQRSGIQSQHKQSVSLFEHSLTALCNGDMQNIWPFRTNSFTTTTTFKAQPTELFLFLQQDEAERRVPQNELSGRGQAHDATSHHGHVICAGIQTTGEVTDSSN